MGFCVLIDILLTGVVWNLIADPFVDYENFKYEFLTVSLCEHTYIPILFTIFILVIVMLILFWPLALNII
uniref:Uncharacterized protein n=1 Tax=Candidatus Phytoplasma australasiaticum subsp. australasiaticum TaxID=2832407 RepID=A0A7S7FZG3_9MOLU|nr:hypothetical protein H7685_02455 ['Parthenium hysterophorus' phyllody phytoplasma]